MTGLIVNPQQILIITIFLAIIFGLWFILKRNHVVLKHNLHPNRRMHVLEDMALNRHERLRLISIDQSDYILLSSRESNSIMLPLTAPPLPQPIGENPVSPIATPPANQSSMHPPAAAQPLPSSPPSSPASSPASSPPSSPPSSLAPSPASSPPHPPFELAASSVISPTDMAAFQEKFKSWRQR